MATHHPCVSGQFEYKSKNVPTQALDTTCDATQEVQIRKGLLDKVANAFLHNSLSFRFMSMPICEPLEVQVE